MILLNLYSCNYPTTYLWLHKTWLTLVQRHKSHYLNQWWLYTYIYMHLSHQWEASQIARFMRPTWGSAGADSRTQVDPMLAPQTLLSGLYWDVWLMICIPQWSLDKEVGHIKPGLTVTMTSSSRPLPGAAVSDLSWSNMIHFIACQCQYYPRCNDEKTIADPHGWVMGVLCWILDVFCYTSSHTKV